MARGHNKGSGLHRKPGEWAQIARGRSNKKRDVATSRPNYGAGGYIKLTDVGSAAYRRLLAKWK